VVIAVSDNGLEHIKEDLWGIYVIAKREFWANLKSIRSAIMVIILALIMVGGAIGFTLPSSTSERDEGFMYHLMAADEDGQLNDLVVFAHFTDDYGPIEDRAVGLLYEDMYNPEYSGMTDERGWFVAKNLTPAFHLLEVDIKVDDGGGVTTGMGVQIRDNQDKTVPIFVAPNVTVPPNMLSIVVSEADLDGKEVLNDLVIHVVGPGGQPVVGATVSVDEETNTSNTNGVSTFNNLKKGNHTVSASAEGNLSGLSIVSVSGKETDIDPFALASADPDAVLNIIANLAMGIFGPIYAIVLCFDAVFREKLTGSIDYLLSRPMGRRSGIVGKFVGIMAALMVPVAAVAMLGMAVISSQSTGSLSGTVVLGFLFYSTLLVSFFALLQMIFSTLAKTTGTAVLSGVGIWLIFSMLFSILVFVVALLRGMDLGSDEFNDWATKVSMVNPIQLYGMAMGVLIGVDMGAGLPNWSPGVTLFLVTFVMFLLTMEIFKRKATE
jgi:ABC-type transport system involved in multi-copper enzyme maturation permease subunit